MTAQIKFVPRNEAGAPAQFFLIHEKDVLSHVVIPDPAVAADVGELVTQLQNNQQSRDAAAEAQAASEIIKIQDSVHFVALKLTQEEAARLRQEIARLQRNLTSMQPLLQTASTLQKKALELEARLKAAEDGRTDARDWLQTKLAEMTAGTNAEAASTIITHGIALLGGAKEQPTDPPPTTT